MIKKNCESCVVTQDSNFGGVCSEAGEIGGEFTKQEHPCWTHPMAWHKLRISTLSKLLLLQEGAILDRNSGTDSSVRRMHTALGRNNKVQELQKRVNDIILRHAPELDDDSDAEDNWYHNFNPQKAISMLKADLELLERDESKIDNALLENIIDRLYELSEYYDIIAGDEDMCPHGIAFREKQEKDCILQEGEDRDEVTPIPPECVKCCNPNCISSPTD